MVNICKYAAGFQFSVSIRASEPIIEYQKMNKANYIFRTDNDVVGRTLDGIQHVHRHHTLRLCCEACVNA